MFFVGVGIGGVADRYFPPCVRAVGDDSAGIQFWVAHEIVLLDVLLVNLLAQVVVAVVEGAHIVRNRWI